MVWAALSWASVVTWAYAKTRDTYVAYRKAGYSKKFREEHEEEILLHQAAKNAFDDTELVYVTVVILQDLFHGPASPARAASITARGKGSLYLACFILQYLPSVLFSWFPAS